jgi:hypothetical protein
MLQGCILLVISTESSWIIIRDNIKIIYFSVIFSFDNIKNILLHEDVCVNLLQNIHNQLPGDTASHLTSTDTECS